MHSSTLRSSPASGLRFAVLCAVLTGCARSEFGWRVAPSLIRSDRATIPAVQIPDTMTAGEPDTVIIWTQSGGCTRKGPTQIISYDTVVTIRLFDSLLVRGPHGPPDYACPLIRSFAWRRVEIRFSHPGQGVVRVVGTDTTQHAVVVQ